MNGGPAATGARVRGRARPPSATGLAPTGSVLDGRGAIRRRGRRRPFGREFAVADAVGGQAQATVVQRAVTRWGGEDPPPALGAMLVAMVCSLRGSVCLYQGEELGVPEADVPFEALQDPYGSTFWPNFKGRDGCRTPMPWRDGAHGGFTADDPWLPVPAAHLARSVEAQLADGGSVLNTVRRFLAWRRTQPALVHGAIRFVPAPEPVLAFVRETDGQRLFAAFNLSGAAVDVAVDAGTARALAVEGLAAGTLHGGRLRLPAYGVCYGELVAERLTMAPATDRTAAIEH